MITMIVEPFLITQLMHTGSLLCGTIVCYHARSRSINHMKCPYLIIASVVIKITIADVDASDA